LKSRLWCPAQSQTARPAASGEVSDLLAQAGGGSDVLIYVHGFKQTFETAVLDAAHLSDAIKFRGRTMAFSWPSKAGLFDFAYDRDSAMFSRDDFEHVLSSIVSAPGASRVHIIAHSMGTMLALESLRQLYAREMFSYIVSNQMVEGSVCIGLRASCRVCARQLSVAHDARRATRKAPLSYSRPH
jgi:esterase/lipase superfamily enzyme